MPVHRLLRAIPRALASAMIAAALALAVIPAGARADGDPASDVLVQTPPVFIPPASGISYGEETAVAAQLRAAAGQGHPLRVAVIPDRIALGSLGAVWLAPERYAVILSDELSLQYRGELLVVMPNGFGVARAGQPVTTPLAHLAPRSGQLLAATEQAIHRLTGFAAGRSAMTAAAPSRTTGTGWWAATAIAVLLIAAAWGASLRARPLRSTAAG